MNRIGFMQGRLSPLVGGSIQAFPWTHWRDEYLLASQYGLQLMEWTLDQKQLHDNPLLTSSGREEIRVLRSRYGLSIPSLTGDCFQQAPFWKANGAERERLELDFLAVTRACSDLGIRCVVVPLVDHGALETREQEEIFLGFISAHAETFRKGHLSVAIESDFGPAELQHFISRLPSDLVGINYDIGNSAALGYPFHQEISAYGDRILNVHVKDRILRGTTVPLGTGNARLPETIAALERKGYRGNYILQTARAVDDDHGGVLCRYRDMLKRWMKQV